MSGRSFLVFEFATFLQWTKRLLQPDTVEMCALSASVKVPLSTEAYTLASDSASSSHADCWQTVMFYLASTWVRRLRVNNCHNITPFRTSCFQKVVFAKRKRLNRRNYNILHERSSLTQKQQQNMSLGWAWGWLW